MVFKKIGILFYFLTSLVLCTNAQRIKQLEWATYLGGNQGEIVGDLAIDNAGFIYVVGSTQSTNNIATSGAYRTANSGNYDVFIAKYSPNGQKIWATYYGGSEDDIGQSIAIDKQGNVVITGLTYSSAGLTITGVHQPGYGGASDIFVSKFTNDGNYLWGTYLGGTKEDIGNDIAVDSQNNIILIGWTKSETNIAAGAAHQSTYSNRDDVVLAKFNQNGQAIWSTYYGGDDSELGLQVEVDGTDHIYISGWTSTTSGFASPGAFQTVYAGGTADAFVGKFHPNGTRLWMTYYGGSREDYADALLVSPIGQVYMGGQSNSDNNISTPGSLQPTLRGDFDLILVHLDTNGARLSATYLGGDGIENCYGLRFGVNGTIWMLSHTASNDNLSVGDVFQTNRGGNYDVWLTQMNGTAQRIQSTYFGGQNIEEGFGMVLDASNAIYISGKTASPTNISTQNATQPIFGGIEDGFIAKFFPCSGTNVNIVANKDTICQGETLQLTASGATTYTWSGPQGFMSNIQNPNVNITSISQNGTYQVIGIDSIGCRDTSAINIVVNPSPLLLISSNSPVCENNSLFFQSSGAGQRQWSGPNGFQSTLQNPTIENVFRSNQGVYKVSLINPQGCRSMDSVVVSILDGVNIIGSTNSPVCVGDTLRLQASGAETYTWSGPQSFVSTLQNPILFPIVASQSGAYKIVGRISNGCTDTLNFNVDIRPKPLLIVSANSPVCEGGQLNLTSTGTGAFRWAGPTNYSSTIQNPTFMNVTSTQAGTYKVTLTSTTGCFSIDSTIVEVLPAPLINVSNNSPLCAGDSLKVMASGANSYIWTGPNNFRNTSASWSLPNAMPNQSGVYTMNATFANGCTLIRTQQLQVNPKPTITIQKPDSVCINFPANITATTIGNLTWSNGAEGKMISIIVKNDTTFIGRAVLNGCTDSTIVKIVIKPQPTIEVSSDTSIFVGEEIQLNAVSNGVVFWSENQGLSCTNCPNPKVKPTEQKAYCAFANLNGCINVKCVRVSILEECEIVLPNIVASSSPANQNWCSPQKPCLLDQWLRIYDRYGNMIYETKGEEVCWIPDLKYDPQVVTFILEITEFNDRKRFETGTITLIK